MNNVIHLTRNKFVVALVAALALTILLSGISTAMAAKQFKVNGDLDGVNGNSGEYIVTVTTSYGGKPTLDRTKTIYTNHQICPDDVNAACYTPAGLFSFPSNKVAYKTYLTICAYEPLTGNENCNFFQKTSKWPPTLRVNVPDKP